MNSFIENVNYIANLDNNYGDEIVLIKNNLSLRNVTNDFVLKFSYFNYNTKQISTITKVSNSILYSELEIVLQDFCTQIESELSGNKFNASYTISTNNTGFLIHNFSITINSLDDRLKATELNVNIKTTSTQVEIYNLYGKVTNPLKLLAVLAMFDDTTMSNINIVVDNILDVNINADNITDININADNINSINTTATNINNVNTNALNISNINLVANTVVPNMNEILLVDDLASQVSSDKIDVQNMKLAVEAIYDSFDDRFLGVFNSNPTLDNDGDPLNSGAMYFNSISSTMRVYSSITTLWYDIPQIYLSTLHDVQLTSISTGDILTWNGSKWINTKTPKVDTIQLNGGAGSEGTLSWNIDEGTANLELPGGSTLQIGQENIRTIRNSTASTIINGTLCMFNGTIGNSGRIKVKPFTAGFNEAMYLYGVATQNITSGSDGIITIEGKVRGIDTTGASVGEVWADEDILYAKPNDSGMMTNIEPLDNELKLIVATVIKAHTNGTLEIRFTPLNENMYYTKVQNDILLNSKVPLSGDFVLDLGGL